MTREEIARRAHRSGSNCASSVYNAFSDVNPNPGTAPRPREDGGKCGAVLAAKKVLEDMGRDSAGFDARFMAAFGAVKCGELRRKGVPCNDLVGAAARMVEDELEG